jgi:integrase
VARGDPRLELYGPSTKHGAKQKKAFKEYRWYIVHRRIELSTGYGLTERRAAELELAAYIRKETVTPDTLTVKEALQNYGLSNPEIHTRDRVGYAGEHLSPALGHLLCSDLTKQIIADYYRDRLGAGAAPWAAWTEISRLRTAVKQSLGHGYKKLELPEKPGPTGVAMTRSQVAKLLWATKAVRRKPARQNLRLLFLIALYCCQRKEACMELCWDRKRGHGYVDLDTMRVCFKKVGVAENKKRRGDMPIPRQVRVALRQARRRTKTWVLQSYKSNGHITDVSNSWERMRKAAGMPHITLHDLIHTGATWRAKQTPQHVLSRLINKSPATLSSIYLHAEQDELEEAANSSPGKRRMQERMPARAFRTVRWRRR